jgi:hypothetical protein
MVWVIHITLRGNQVRLRLPPQAAPAEGPAAPLHQSREAHHIWSKDRPAFYPRRSRRQAMAAGVSR